MKALALLIVIFFSTPSAKANQLLELYGRMRQAWTGGSGGGIQESLSQEDCVEMLEDDREERGRETIHDVIYFLGDGYSDKGLYSPSEIAPNCKSNIQHAAFKIGLTSKDWMRANSYDSKSPLAEMRCIQYMKLKKVEVVKLNLDGKTQTCRRMKIDLGEETFHSFFCVGDNHAYVDYHGYPAEVIQEIPLGSEN